MAINSKIAKDICQILDQETSSQTASLFPKTQWTTVALANHGDEKEKQQALERICSQYWQPVYYYIKSQGVNATEAQDVTQDFFADFLERDSLAKVAQNKGRFRAFLLVCIKHFLANYRRYLSAEKRGGKHLQWINFQSIPDDEIFHEKLTPEKIFDKNWTRRLIVNAYNQLKNEHVHAHKEKLFELLEPRLWEDCEALSYSEISKQLNISEAALKVTVFRMKAKFANLIINEIGQTVSHPDLIKEEMAELMRCFQN